MADYFHHVRSDIKGLLPTNATRILDLGAGAGETARWLKSFYLDAETVGIEINPQMATELERNVDIAVMGPVDDNIARLGKFDLVLALDVLEHLPDPEATVAKIRNALMQDGVIIISVPNIAHYSVVLPLLVGRRFRYRDAGIMDRTHLRFFVEDTAIELITNAGMRFEAGLLSGLQGQKARSLDTATFGLFRHYLTKQYLMRGRLTPQAAATAGSWQRI